MTDMPWDRFARRRAEEPELPYRPPPADTFGPWRYPPPPIEEVIDRRARPRHRPIEA